MPTTFDGGISSSLKGRHEAPGLVDAGGQDHQRVLVEDDLQVETQLLNRMRHERLLGCLHRDDGAAGHQRSNASPCEKLYERGARRAGQRSLSPSIGAVHNGAVFGDDAIEKAQARDRGAPDRPAVARSPAPVGGQTP